MVIPAPGPGFSRREASNYCNFLSGTGEHILVQIIARETERPILLSLIYLIQAFPKVIAEQSWSYLDEDVDLAVQRDPVAVELLHRARAGSCYRV